MPLEQAFAALMQEAVRLLQVQSQSKRARAIDGLLRKALACDYVDVQRPVLHPLRLHVRTRLSLLNNGADRRHRLKARTNYAIGMDDELSVQQKMSRFASPLVGERSPKRSRKSLEPQDMEKPTTIIDIIEDGDALMVVKGLPTLPDTQVGLRVSSFAMSMASQVFKAQFATAALKREEEPKTVLTLPDDHDGDAVLVVLQIIHLRADKLPAQVSADQLHQITLFAEAHDCKVAIGRSTTQWFDRLYHKNNSDQADLCKIIEAAYLLDEAVWFARFTSRWVLNSRMLAPQLPEMHTTHTLKLALTLASQQSSSHIRLRMDFDQMVDIAVRCFSREYRHYIDWAPEMSPDPSETPSGKPPVRCRVDGDGGQEFLGALRDAEVWPSDMWFRGGGGSVSTSAEEANRVSIGTIVDRLAEFTLPEYDDADRCEFCDGVKTEFAAAVKDAKRAQKERLWGLCLDCFKPGGFNAGECRFEHAKQHSKKADLPSQGREMARDVASEAEQKEQQRGGLGIEGL